MSNHKPTLSFAFLITTNCVPFIVRLQPMTYTNNSARTSTVSGEEVLAIIDKLLPEGHPCGQLSDKQVIVLCHTWEDCSYQQIADDFGYQVDYIRQIASQLWRTLSKATGEKVSKKNLRSVLRRYQLRHSVEVYDIGVRPSSGIQDWSEAIDVSIFYGRHSELTKLEQWISWNRCRLISIHGLGGIGKTTFAIKLAQKLESQFDYIVWRSLKSAPLPADLYADILTVLQDGELFNDQPPSLALLMRQLHEKRCLLILDSLDSIFQAGDRAGQCLPGYEAYHQLLEQMATINHQSCLLLTSREQPQSLEQWGGEHLPVRSITLKGLARTAGQQILADKGWNASHLDQDTLIQHFDGNPHLLKVAVAKIQNLFDGDLDQFLTHGHTIFGDLWNLFDQQFHRLSPLQHSLMYWLAINRGGCHVRILQSETQEPMREIFEALEALHQRSLITSNQAGITQPPAVMEYVTGQLMAILAKEILEGDLHYCRSHRLLPAQSNSTAHNIQPVPGIFARETHRMFKILVEHLRRALGTKSNLEQHLNNLLDRLHGNDTNYRQVDYAASNILNICSYLGIDYAGMNRSPLVIRSVDISIVDLN
jgi:hypothetical protein